MSVASAAVAAAVVAAPSDAAASIWALVVIVMGNQLMQYLAACISAAFLFVERLLTFDVATDYMDSDNWKVVCEYLAHLATTQNRRSHLFHLLSAAEGTSGNFEAHGAHVVRLGPWNYIIVRRAVRSHQMQVMAIPSARITFLGWWDARKRLEALIEAARSHDVDGAYVSVFTACGGTVNRWSFLRRLPVRAASTLTLPNDGTTSLIAQHRAFLATKDAYTRLTKEQPRRSYLLVGPPGCGKTSFATVLASELERPIYCYQPVATRASGVSANDAYAVQSEQNFLPKLMAAVPKNAILLIEDIDRAFRVEDRIDASLADVAHIDVDQDGGDVAASGGELTPAAQGALAMMLNILDGMLSPPCDTIILTANSAQRLPSVLARPGRVDDVVRIGHLDGALLAAHLTSVYGAAAVERACRTAPWQQVVTELPRWRMTMSWLQRAIKRVRERNITRHGALDSPGDTGADTDVTDVLTALTALADERRDFLHLAQRSQKQQQEQKQEQSTTVGRGGILHYSYFDI